MKTFNFENPEKQNLFSRLERAGLSSEELKDFRILADRVKFSNIDINSELGAIHVDMIAALLTKQKNSEIFLQNILKSINHDWREVQEILVSSTNEIEIENIDLGIGANRRVDKVECIFNNQDIYNFTLSADLVDHEDISNSNSYVEKEVFESPLAKDNPVLQKYFGYLERKLSGRNYRLIAKEYLPGKNIAQYFNELEGVGGGAGINAAFDDVSCELAYSMGSLYKRMNGQLLEDLKLENIIYNYEDPDAATSACRACDHSGYYDKDAEYKSASQIVAQLNSLLTIYSLKISQLEKNNDASQEDYQPEVLLVNYLDSFLSELNDDHLSKILLEKIREIKETKPSERVFDLPEDLLNFVIDYLENHA